jgi:hypothetical protein
MTGVASAPVFVVGGPRSGTTLLAAMLAAHSAFDCGPETHCLWRWSRLGRRVRARILDPDDWPEAATRFVCSLRLGERRVHLLYGLDRDAVRAWLTARPPSLAALLGSLTEQRAARHGRPRWVEKTPRHLEVAELIASTWPEARILRIVRDPRDAAVSLTRVPFGTPSMVTNLSMLARMDEASAAFFRVATRAMTLRYEDLVVEPERELRRVCAHVGVAYEPTMIEDRARSDGLAAEHEWWKGPVTGPLDPSRVGGWRRDMPPAVQRYAALNLAAYLAEHGYEEAREPARRVAIVPAGDALSARYDPMLLRLAAADVAVERPVPVALADLARRRPLVFFGLPGQLDPGRRGSAARRSLALPGLAMLLLWRRLIGRPAAWVPRLSLLPRRRQDAGERAVHWLLRLTARRVEADEIPVLATSSPAGTSPGSGGRLR